MSSKTRATRPKGRSTKPANKTRTGGPRAQGKATRPRGVGKKPATTRTGPGPRSLLVAVAAGLVFTLVVLTLGVAFVQGGSDARSEPANDQVASDKPSQEAVAGGVDLDVKARNAGNLKMQIAARVRLNRGSDPLGQADVVAYTDMSAMPGAHASEPVPMQEVPGDPGIYSAETTVPMVGDYEVKVQVRSPVQAEATKVVDMGVTRGQ